MKKLFKLGLYLLILGTSLGPSLSQAYNSATHIFLVKQVIPFTFDKINLFYGSIAPDIPLYADLERWPNGFCETHYKFIKLTYTWWNISQKAFAQGWQTHSEKSWQINSGIVGGADFYAHGTCSNCSDLNTCQYNGYVPTQAYTLAQEIPFLQDYPELAHFAIEVAIDLLLIDYYDHDLGKDLLKATLFRSPVDFNLMMKVFVGKTGYGTDLETLTSAESIFRNLVIRYAFALTLSEPLRMGVLGELGVEVAEGMGVPQGTINSATVREILQEAMDLCEETNYYENTILPAIEGIKKIPDLIK